MFVKLAGEQQKKRTKKTNQKRKKIDGANWYENTQKTKNTTSKQNSTHANAGTCVRSNIIQKLQNKKQGHGLKKTFIN